MGIDLKHRFNSLNIRLNLFLLNSLIDKQTRIKEYGGKVQFITCEYGGKVSHMMENNPKKIRKNARLLGS